MKGKNLLRLNQATLVQALQEYLDRVMPGQRVIEAKSVANNSWDSGSMLQEVVVEVEAVEPAKTEAQGGAAQ